MATDTAPKQTDTKPAASPKAAAPARRKPKPRAKTRRTTTRTTRTRKPATPAATQPRATNGSRQAFAGVLDVQEKTVTALTDYQVRAAELSQIPGAAAVAGAQAQVLRSVTDAYVSAARALLK